MTTTTFRPDSRSERMRAMPKAQKSQKSRMHQIKRYVIGIDIVLVILWVIFASIGPAQLNRMSTTQSSLTVRNGRLISANQQMKSDILTITSAGSVSASAAGLKLVQETAPEASVDMDRNQASAASQ